MNNFSIVITTFEHRFADFFCPLLNSIKKMDSDIEVIVTVNGEHEQLFNQTYRKQLLQFISQYENVYPVMFPTFRGLAKLWNSGVIASTNDYVLIMNDDITLKSKSFIEDVNTLILANNTSFELNSSFSHAVLKKSEVIENNFFDERLLGIGEEEEFIWRWEERYKQKFTNCFIDGVINHVDFSHSPTNIKPGSSGKYSAFNRNKLFTELYRYDEGFGKQRGKISEKLIHNHMENQYPYEKYYLENRNKL